MKLNMFYQIKLSEKPLNLEELERKLRLHSDQSFYNLGLTDSGLPILFGTDRDVDESPDPYFPGVSPPISSGPVSPKYIPPGTGKFQRPTTGRVSSPFGMRIHPVTKKRKLHKGVDLAPGRGKPIVAAENGTVTFSGVQRGYGNVIYIQHANDVETRYAHCESLLVKKGVVVKKGQQIATVGNTGLSTGPHLHFEIRVKGEPKDPLPWIS